MSIRILLNDLSPGTQYAIQFRSNDGAGSVSEWSQVQRFTTTNDTVHPGNVANLNVSDSGGSIMATWDQVTLNENNSTFNDFRWYHVQITNGSKTVDYTSASERFEFSREMNIATFGTFQYSLTIKVWAVDMTHNESRAAATAVSSPSNPPTPSMPVVAPWLGLLKITWDCKTSTGAVMPPNVSYAEVHVSTTSNFTPSASTLQDRVFANGAGSTAYITGAYGTKYYIKLVAVNEMLRTSAPSAEANGTPVRATGLDIQDNAISTQQINFTAAQIGGANAYYPATVTAMNAIVGAKSQDIAYVTGSGYATYRYDGTTWVSAPEIGLVSGAKILAGTLTSNAVGTNLLIAANANIANGVIDDAKISGLSAGKITAGTIASDVIIGGRFTTALSGGRSEMSALGFRKFDVDGVTKMIDFTGTNNLLTGTLQTALGGRRMVLGAAGALGEIDFYSPSGTLSLLRAFTEGQSTIESIQMGVPITSNAGATYDFLWNRWHANSDEWAQMRSNKIDFMFGTHRPGDMGFFVVRQTPDRGAATYVNRLMIDSTGTYLTDEKGKTKLSFSSGSAFSIMDDNGYGRFYTNGPGTALADGNGVARVSFNAAGVGLYDTAGIGRVFATAVDTTLYPAGGNNGSFQVSPSGSASQTAWVKWFTAGGYGQVMVCTMDSPGVNMRMELKNWDGASWHPFWASGYVVQSDEEAKTGIKLYNDSALAKVRNTPVHTYKRKGSKDSKFTRKEVGLIAQTAPDEIRVSGEGFEGIDLYGAVGLSWASIKEMADRLEQAEAKIKELESHEPKK